MLFLFKAKIKICLGTSFGKVDNYFIGGHGALKFRKNYGQLGLHWTGRLSGVSYSLRFNRIDYHKAKF